MPPSEPRSSGDALILFVFCATSAMASLGTGPLLKESLLPAAEKAKGGDGGAFMAQMPSENA